MRSDPRPVDYTKVKTTSLQQLAAGGDTAAMRELERRGQAMTTAIDVTRLSAHELRMLVRAWRDGVLPIDRAHFQSLAVQAQQELEVRYAVDSKLYDGTGPAPQAPSIAPWLVPEPRRCASWRRPGGSTLYPSERDRTRAALNATTREVYQNLTSKAAGVPQKDK